MFKKIVLFIVVGVLPYYSYFTFHTPVYIISFYQYVELKSNDEADIKKIGHQLYMAENKGEVIQYFEKNNMICLDADKNVLNFIDDKNDKSIKISIAKEAKHFVILHSYDKVIF